MSMIYDRKPAEEGFRMPAEWADHRGCILIWPERPGSWPGGAVKAREAFRNVIAAIAESEQVFVAVSETGEASARQMLSNIKNVEIFRCETDDAWARDVGPTYVVRRESEASHEDASASGADHASAGMTEAGGAAAHTSIADGMFAESLRTPSVRGVNWSFNAWGGEYNGLYASWDKDQAFAEAFCAAFGYELYDAVPFVLEGGSIHSDGEGTLLVTESCLLSPGRNPALTKEQIEEKLKQYLGIEKVLWLPRGISGDETDEHVDNVCCFSAPGELLLAWTDDESDPQYALSHADLQYLESETDAKGRKLTVRKLPIPEVPITIREEDLNGYIFEAGEDERQVGDRLAASYVNFYISNGSIVFPVFGGENAESDALAQQILQRAFPNREMRPVYARDILAGGGNIHCITQQVPSGK